MSDASTAEIRRRHYLAYLKDWRKRNPDKACAYRKAWRRNNREKYNASRRIDAIPPETRQRNVERCRRWKKANPDYSLKRLYGMSLDEYRARLAAQGGGCALCGNRTRMMAVDHCHETGRIRGILCNVHNRAIGVLGDTVGHMERVVRYLRGDE